MPAELAENHRVYDCGQGQSRKGHEETENLFIEADGVFISLQKKDREKSRKTEIKMGYGYSDREKVYDGCEGGPRYSIEGKRFFVGICKGDEFWENLGIRLNEKWATEKTQRFVIGGDGAPWIRKGTGYFPKSLFQLDRFHYKRAVNRVYGFSGKEQGELMGWLENPPDKETAMKYFEALLENCTDDEKKLKKIHDLRSYIITNLNYIKDYRKRINEPDLPPLGTCEGNIDKVLANRFKKRGMSWSLEGADSLAKVIGAVRNQDIRRSTRTVHRAFFESAGMKSILTKNILKKEREIFTTTQGKIPDLEVYRSEFGDRLKSLLRH